MECPELEKLIEDIQGEFIPFKLRPILETHLNECRSCRAGMNNFLKISQILEKTVYGESPEDKYLAYLSKVAGKKLRWENLEESQKRSREMLRGLIIKVVAGFVVAAGLGASAVVILGHLGIIGKGGPEVEIAADTTAGERAYPGPGTPGAYQDLTPGPAYSGSDSGQLIVLPENGLTPDAIYELLNSTPDSDSGLEGPTAAEKDSSHLRIFQSELGALRDALSRTPLDRDLRKRTMDKYRQVIEERKRLGRPASVNEYYGLGYLHYSVGEYPQTAIVTAEGLRMVRMGPTQYLHYLKAMAHYQLALKASSPLPADTTSDEEARIRGAALRAKLDAEGRRRAVIEFRKAITEFSHLLKNPDLEPTAREWILKCSELIEQSATQP
jgi:hypothetical protein